MTMEKKEKSKHVLIAEDDKFLMRALSDKLEREGFSITKAENGEECIKELRENGADVVLLDLMMPVKNGFEVLEEIKNDEKLSKIPVVVLSNLGQDSDIEKSKSLGAAEFFVKANFSIREIIDLVNKYI